jgi:hypothetical protein
MKEKLVTCTDPKFREIEPLLKEGWRIKDVKFASDSGIVPRVIVWLTWDEETEANGEPTSDTCCKSHQLFEAYYRQRMVQVKDGSETYHGFISTVYRKEYIDADGNKRGMPIFKVRKYQTMVETWHTVSQIEVINKEEMYGG